MKTLNGWAQHRQAAERRAVAAAGARQRRSAFAAAMTTRLNADWVMSAIPADDELRWNLRTLRARARDLERNNPYVGRFLDLLETNVLGAEGPTLQAQTRTEDGELVERVNSAIEEAWREWAEGPVTVDGRFSLVEFEEILLRGWGRDGESFARIYDGFDQNPFRFALQGIEADLVDETLNQERRADGTEIRLGIEVNPLGRPLAYHVWDNERKVYDASGQRIRIPADEMIHLFRPRRANQTRGYTLMAGVMGTTKMLDGYEESELVAARTAAAKMGFLTSTDGFVAGETDDPAGTNAADASISGGSVTVTGELAAGVLRGPVMEANPGSIEQLDPGWKFEAWNPAHPTDAFETFVKTQLRKIGAGLGVSYHALANDLRDTNYSSMRGGELIDRELWRRLQKWWIRQFRRRVFLRWLNMALLSGKIPLDSRDWRQYRKHTFTPRGWKWVDPKNDAETAALELERGLTTRQRIAAERGEDWTEIFEQLRREQVLAQRLGLSIDGPQPAGTGAGEDADRDEGGEEEDGTSRSRANTKRAGVARSRLAASRELNGSAH